MDDFKEHLEKLKTKVKREKDSALKQALLKDIKEKKKVIVRK